MANDITDNPILDQAKREERAEVSTTAAPSSDVVDPRLVDIQSALTQSSARISSSIKNLEQSTKQTKAQTDVITSAVNEAVAATQITATAQMNADLQAQNSTIDAFEASGGAEIQAQLMATLKQDGDRVAALLDEKSDIVDDEFTGIGLIDGVINELRSFQTDLEIDAATAQQNQTLTQIQATTAATESFAKANALTKKTLNQGVIEANYKAIEAEGKIRGAEASLKGMKDNADAMVRLVNADQRGVANLLQVWRLEGEAEGRAITRERQSFQREQMQFAREKWEIDLPAAEINLKTAQLRLKTAQTTNSSDIQAALANNEAAVKRHEDQVATQETLVNSVSRGQALAGLPVDDRETIIWGLKNSDKLVRAKYVRLQELGGVTNPVLGQTPFEARESLSIIDPSGNVEPTAGIQMLDQATKVLIEKYRKDPKGIPKDEETIKSDFNEAAKIMASAAANDIREGDASNPYQSPSMPILASYKSVKESSLYKKVLEPMAMKETSPQRIFDATIAGVIAKTVSPEEAAAGIEAVFDAAAAHNNTYQGGFRRVGLPNQVSYNSFIRRPATSFEQLKTKTSVFLSVDPIDAIRMAATGEPSEDLLSAASGAIKEVKVDLMNRTSIQHMITRLLSAEKPPEKEPNAETITTGGTRLTKPVPLIPDPGLATSATDPKASVDAQEFFQNSLIR